MTAGHIVKLGFVSLMFYFWQHKTEVGFAVTPFSVLLGVFIHMLNCW
ncbi:MAG: hypothetical protein U5L09_11555 [Bacteroidales bacterium]|nr:hypothetical protein [Bacteroidales bacterium]